MFCTHSPTAPTPSRSQSVEPSAPLLSSPRPRRPNDFCPRPSVRRVRPFVSLPICYSPLCFYLFPLSPSPEIGLMLPRMQSVASFPLDTKTNYSAPASSSSSSSSPRRCHVRLCFRFHAYLHFCGAAMQSNVYDVPSISEKACWIGTILSGVCEDGGRGRDGRGR